MKYWVLVMSAYSGYDLREFDHKDNALECVAENSGDDTWCKLLEGQEIPFKIITTAVEDTE